MRGPPLRAGLVLLACGLLFAGTPVRAAPPAAGAQAPRLVMRTFSGAQVEVASLRGKVVLVHYWASWCVPCREEMPRLDALARAHPGDLAVLALSADDRHDRRAAQDIASAFAFESGMAGEAPDNGFGSPLGLPTTYVIDREGRIAAVLRASKGEESAAALGRVLQSLGVAVQP